MSYLVLARKYRPQTFNEVIGQEHIVELLTKAISTNRIAHAYLLTGPRGVGKTSCARILAKSLNCEKGPTLNPCGKCSACLEIAKGTSFDVIEVDGASNRGIDEIRTLRENVKFAPTYGKFKIYIVDEVHMLTSEAFNALLKTLEEPPEHVKFIFATTSPNKVPATILSRCQRFDFKRISIKTTVDALAEICKKEKLTIDNDALYAIAKAAQGGMRDALSILDQLSALNERTIVADDVFSMLGIVETQFLFDLTDALAQKNCVQTLEILEKITDKGKDIKQFVKELIEHFRHLMIIKVGGKALGKMVDYPIAIKDQLLIQAEKFSLPDILSAIDILIDVQETSRITESVQLPLEVAFARMTYSPLHQSTPIHRPTTTMQTPSPSARPAAGQNKPNPPTAPQAQAVNQMQAEEPELVTEMPGENSLEPISTEALDCERIKKAWDTLTYAVSREKMSVATFLQEGTPVVFKDGVLTVSFPATCKFQKESLETPTNKAMVERIFAEKLRSKIVITYTIGSDHEPKEEDPMIKSALDKFKGKVVSRWHNE